MAKLSTPVVAVLAAVLAAAASAQTRPQAGAGGEEGFFRPARDPALTSIRPPPAPEAKPAAPVVVQPTQAAALEVAEAIREAEEKTMERVEAERAAALAAAAQPAKGPAVTSPLDGSAPILSPLDGTAPIISPVTR